MGDHVGILDVVLKFPFAFSTSNLRRKFFLYEFCNRYCYIHVALTSWDQYTFRSYIFVCVHRHKFYHFQRGHTHSHQVRKSAKHRKQTFVIEMVKNEVINERIRIMVGKRDAFNLSYELLSLIFGTLISTQITYSFFCMTFLRNGCQKDSKKFKDILCIPSCRLK